MGTNESERRRVPALVRLSIAVLLGVGVAGLAFYAMRELGY